MGRAYPAAALLAALWLTAPALHGLEGSSPDLEQDRRVEQRASVLKPAHVFSMRGRRDPFSNPSQWQTAGTHIFNISGLAFKGLVEVDGHSTALFLSVNDRSLFTLRGSQLYGSNNRVMAGVSGRILNSNEVRLRQGESSITFSALRSAKRKL